MARGRPPVTRQRVLNYIEKHRPETIMQIVRATGADRRHIYRILMAVYGPNFRSKGVFRKENPFGDAEVALAA